MLKENCVNCAEAKDHEQNTPWVSTEWKWCRIRPKARLDKNSQPCTLWRPVVANYATAENKGGDANA